VFDTFQRWQLEMERNPVEFLGRRSGTLLAHARTQLGACLGARAEDLAFVANATTAINTVARSLAALLAPDDEVLGTDHEYGACDATWQRVCEAAGARYRRLTVPLPLDEAGFVDRVMAAVTPRTRVLFTSHITSTTALRFPVEALSAAARQRGLITVIDGAHAPGQVALHLDALGADFYTGNCHKWMCAPKGSAFLHVRPEWQSRLHASVVSWGYVAGDGGHTGFDAYTGRSLLERRLQWQGTRDLAAFLTVPAAIDFQQRHGWPALRERCHALACATLHRVLARNGLQPIAPDGAYGQMVPIPVRTSEAEALRKHLFDRHRIEVPVTQHGEHTFVRVSVQAYNTPAELDLLVDALAQLDI
jgi:isopenicillin-N epimerase